MHEIFLLIGGNLGNRLLNISKAIVSINKQIGKITQRSGIYETEPWGFDHEKPFYNMVVVCESALTPREVLSSIHSIEHKLGRVRNLKGYEGRIIDIDILFYNHLIMKEPDLIIPHPELHKRLFTLIPLMEINAGFIHPAFNKSIKSLYEDCPDNKSVVKIDY